MVAVVVAVGAGGTMTAAAEVEGTVEVEGVEEMAEVVESEVVAVDQTVGSIVFEGSPPPPTPLLKTSSSKISTSQDANS